MGNATPPAYIVAGRPLVPALVETGVQVEAGAPSSWFYFAILSAITSRLSHGGGYAASLLFACPKMSRRAGLGENSVRPLYRALHVSSNEQRS